MRVDSLSLLLTGLLVVTILSCGGAGSTARAAGAYAVVPGSLIDAMGQFVQDRGPIKVDAATVLVPNKLIEVGVKPTEAAAGPTEGMARLLYRAMDPTTGQPKAGGESVFQMDFILKDGAWAFTKAAKVTVAEGKETFTPVDCFNPPPPKPKLGVLEGEQGKPVQTTASGMKYVVLEEGKGDKPTKGATISAEYTGWLMDGTQFDSSKDHDGTFEFPVGQGQVIKGWDEALLDMKVGERRKLTIPPALGYGERGTPGGPIPPNATLIFEVKLVAIK